MLEWLIIQGQIYIYRYSSTTIVNLSMLDKKKEEGEEEKKIYLKGYYHGFEEWPCYFYVKKPPLLKRDLTKKANAPMNNGTRTLSPVSSFLASMLSTHCLSLGVALLNCLVIDAKIYMHIYIYMHAVIPAFPSTPFSITDFYQNFDG